MSPRASIPAFHSEGEIEMAKGLLAHKIEWEPFDKFGGYNPKGTNWALSIDGIEILDFWSNGLITAPVGSPAEQLGKKIPKQRWK